MRKMFSLALMLVLISGFSVFQPKVTNAAQNVAYWECYFCHKTATTAPDNPSAQTPRAHFPFTNEGCTKNDFGHGWVWKGGVLPQDTNLVVYICTYCKNLAIMTKANSAPPKTPFGCLSNNNRPHNWVLTGIVNNPYE